MDALIEDLLNILRSVPIIPIIIVFSLLKRFISKKPDATTEAPAPQPAVAPTQPDDGYGSTRGSVFDGLMSDDRVLDPSIDPVPADTVFGGEYGKTKFGFDDSDWDSGFDDRWGDKVDDTPKIHVR